MSICEDPRLIGFAIGPINEYETKIATKLLNNADSWLGLNDSHMKTLQIFQDNFIRKVFQVLARCTPMARQTDAKNEVKDNTTQT